MVVSDHKQTSRNVRTCLLRRLRRHCRLRLDLVSIQQIAPPKTDAPHRPLLHQLDEEISSHSDFESSQLLCLDHSKTWSSKSWISNGRVGAGCEDQHIKRRGCPGDGHEFTLTHKATTQVRGGTDFRCNRAQDLAAPRCSAHRCSFLAITSTRLDTQRSGTAARRYYYAGFRQIYCFCLQGGDPAVRTSILTGGLDQ
jgi:hypothetical protein